MFDLIESVLIDGIRCLPGLITITYLFDFIRKLLFQEG